MLGYYKLSSVLFMAYFRFLPDIIVLIPVFCFTESDVDGVV